MNLEFRKIISFFIATMVIMAIFAFLTQHSPIIPNKYYPVVYDEDLSIYYATIGKPRPKPTTSLPSGQWYTNLNFDPDSSNYAKVGLGGYAYLRAYSTATFWTDCHGWSNAFFHQGRLPYAGGIYEGKFKAKYPAKLGTIVEQVDGIRYPFDSAIGENWIIEIRAKVNKRVLNSANSFASVLFFALFQYEFADGTYSKYDSKAFTDMKQSVHFDIFISRTLKTFYVYKEDEVGTTTIDWGDAYNSDLHVQYVAGKMSNVGQWYTIKINWAQMVKKVLELTKGIWNQSIYRGIALKALILRWIGISAEVIGAELEVQIDYVKSYWVDVI